MAFNPFHILPSYLFCNKRKERKKTSPFRSADVGALVSHSQRPRPRVLCECLTSPDRYFLVDLSFTHFSQFVDDEIAVEGREIVGQTRNSQPLFPVEVANRVGEADEASANVVVVDDPPPIGEADVVGIPAKGLVANVAARHVLTQLGAVPEELVLRILLLAFAPVAKEVHVLVAPVQHGVEEVVGGVLAEIRLTLVQAAGAVDDHGAVAVGFVDVDHLGAVRAAEEGGVPFSLAHRTGGHRFGYFLGVDKPLAGDVRHSVERHPHGLGLVECPLALGDQPPLLSAGAGRHAVRGTVRLKIKRDEVAEQLRFLSGLKDGLLAGFRHNYSLTLFAVAPTDMIDVGLFVGDKLKTIITQFAAELAA